MKTALVILVSLSVIELGCDVKVTPTEPISKVAAAPAPKPVIRPEQLGVSDFSLRLSSTIPVTGDLRPLYLVAGRIQNNSPYTLTGIRLVVEIWNAKGMKDSAILDLKMNILTGEAQTFAQNVHLLPPPGKWNWSYFAQSIDCE